MSFSNIPLLLGYVIVIKRWPSNCKVILPITKQKLMATYNFIQVKIQHIIDITILSNIKLLSLKLICSKAGPYLIFFLSVEYMDIIIR